MSKDYIRQVQQRQLEMVCKLHRICEENHLCYIMLGGTLLGAVRHKGFIPWDDDLDIGLPRQDYDKLLELLQEKPIEGCFLQCHETEKHYIQPFAKLRLDGTAYLETYTQHIDMHQGVFVDIFPLDKIDAPGSFGTESRRLIAKAITFAIWRKEKFVLRRKGVKRVEKVVSHVLGVLPKKWLVAGQNMLVRREKRSWHYRGSMFSSNYSSSKVYFKDSDFDDRILMDFENTKLYGPREYDRVLGTMFKNYMQLPPENKRNSGHDVVEVRL